MTETEKKALALVNEVRAEHGGHPNGIIAKNTYAWDALCRAIEQHEAFKREVSDAVEKTTNAVHSDSSLIVWSQMRRFIIPKLDPLVEAMRDACGAQGIATKHTPGELTKHFRTALAARGGRIVWEGE